MSSTISTIFGAVALAAAVAASGGVAAADLKAQPATRNAKSQHWSAWGGTVGLRWNRDLASDIGLVIDAVGARAAPRGADHPELFDLRQSGSLEFDVRNGNLAAFVGGSLQALGGPVIDTPAGRIDLSNFRIVPRAGATPILDIVGADGKAWFYIDRLMYELIDGKQRLAVRTMDLRITPALAARIGQPAVADWVIADMALTTDVQRQGADPAPPQEVGFKWAGAAVPGVPGAVYEADLFMQTFSMQYSRCNGCTGVGGNGSVVFTPSSTLRNNVNNGTLQPTVAGDALGTSNVLYTADVPWYSKFSGNFPPYANDQHPYLIWNLYRLNVNGTIDQIGRSGVKHAFLTVNTACLDNPGDSHVLGRGCSDVYSVSDNDNNNALGPRSEIVPATNQWGRCGSIYDTNCDGIANVSPNGLYDQRLNVSESQISGPAQAGATYLFESWYLARDDRNILNSMGTTRATFTRNGSVWSVGGNDTYKLGPAIDRWVDPAQPGAGATSVLLSTPEGHMKVAGRATNLGGSRWRYDYAVMNLDFARARTEGAEPNLRVLSNLGFSAFTVPVGTATITDLAFSDGDSNTANDWTGNVVNNHLVWTAPSGHALNWGTMFRFSFIANQGSAKGWFALSVAEAGTPLVYKGRGSVAPAEASVFGPR